MPPNSLYNHTSPRLSALELEMVRKIPPGGNWRDIPSGLSARVDQIKRRSEQGIVHTTYYGRLREDAPSYTINTYFSRIGNGCFLHPRQLRLLSLREGARLQSFPDRVRFFGPLRSQYEQVGNAVPPMLAYALGRTLPAGTAVDLFAGAGGMSLGLSLAGFDVVYAADRSSHACTTLNNAHGAEVALVRDLSDPAVVSAVSDDIATIAGGSPDLLTAGPPCQGFSTAGRRLVGDPRSTLFWVPFEIAELIRPRTLVIENVQGILSMAQGRLIEEIERRIGMLGLVPHRVVLRAEEFGVPQRRTRVFFVGTSEPWTPPEPVCSRNGESLWLAPPLTVDEAISDLPLLEHGQGGDVCELRSPAQSDFQRWARAEITVGELLATRCAAAIAA